MDAVSQAIFAAWYLAIAARACAFGGLVRRGLCLRYPIFCVVLPLLTVKSFLLMHAYAVGGVIGHLKMWLCTQPIEMGLYALLVFEAFVLQGKAAQPFLKAGVIIGVVFVAFATVVIWTTAPLGAETIGGAEPVVLRLRYFELGCAIVLMLSRGFFALFGIAMRPNLVRHVWILTLMIGADGMGHAIRQVGTYTANAIACFVILIPTAVAGVLWTVLIRQDGERTPVQPPRDTTHDEDFWRLTAALRQGQRRTIRELIRRIREAVQDWMRLPSLV